MQFMTRLIVWNTYFYLLLKCFFSSPLNVLLFTFLVFVRIVLPCKDVFFITYSSLSFLLFLFPLLFFFSFSFSLSVGSSFSLSSYCSSSVPCSYSFLLSPLFFFCPNISKKAFNFLYISFCILLPIIYSWFQILVVAGTVNCLISAILFRCVFLFPPFPPPAPSFFLFFITLQKECLQWLLWLS